MAALSIPMGPGPVRVLITEPGPRVSETIHGFVAQGATVTVESSAPDAALVDLASRRLVTLLPHADPRDHDLVLRDPATRTPAPRPPEDAETGAPTAVGEIVLVGGGPGSIDLLTVAGLAEIERADVLVCDRLTPLAALGRARPDAEIIHVGKIPRGEFTPQERINELLVDRALAGRRVVRLKGGDPFVFGRGGEEWIAAVERGIPVRVVPGVSSAIAVPGLAGIPLTHRSLSQGFVVVTGHVAPGDPRGTVDWEALGGLDLTIVILMGAATLPAIVDALVRGGLDPDTPAASVADGSMPSQRSVVATASTLAEAMHAAGITPPAVTVIGAVVAALPSA